MAVMSMTGFARVRRVTPEIELALSLKGVNHRGLDLQFHIPPEVDPFEPAIRKAIMARVSRGHIDVRVQVLRQGTASASFNRPLLETWLAAFRQVQKETGLEGIPDLNAALRVPGMLANPDIPEPGPEFGSLLMDCLEEALERYNAERAREGAATASALEPIRSRLGAAAREMEQIRGSVIPVLQERMRERLSEMLKTSGALDPARLAQEAAVLADRGDIHEETTRLSIHAARLGALLEAGGDVGKKIEFLAQEMQREANTILSKSNAAGESGRRLTELALAVKSDVEKIREQSLNLE